MQGSCSKGGSGQIPRGLCCLCKIIKSQLGPLPCPNQPWPLNRLSPCKGRWIASVSSSGAAGRGRVNRTLWGHWNAVHMTGQCLMSRS